jgi:hypothetical protein
MGLQNLTRYLMTMKLLADERGPRRAGPVVPESCEAGSGTQWRLGTKLTRHSLAFSLRQKPLNPDQVVAET